MEVKCVKLDQSVIAGKSLLPRKLLDMKDMQTYADRRNVTVDGVHVALFV